MFCNISDPSSDVYCGTAPFSESETRAIADFVTRNGPFDGFIDYHRYFLHYYNYIWLISLPSYSQMVLRPYGWTINPPPNYDEELLVGEAMRDTIRATTGVQYTSEIAWKSQITTGTARDWFCTTADSTLSYLMKYSLCISLRRSGE
jgi:hypothetical protein